MENLLLQMIGLTARGLRFLRGFRRREDGNATVEFVLVFPAFMILFVSAFESGIMMTRNAMLERGLDMAVRAVRIKSSNTAVTPTDMRRMICNGAGIIPNCMTDLRVEMRRVDPRDWVNVPVAADCVNKSDNSQAAAVFTNGKSNQIMVVRACALFKPIFPATGLGFQLPRKTGGYYALVASSSFVVEPN